MVGPVVITAIDPAPTEDRNGSVKNLSGKPGNRSGFDGRVPPGRWLPSMRAQLPISLVPSDTLVSSISLAEADDKPLREKIMEAIDTEKTAPRFS